MISCVSEIGAQETISRIEINVDPFFLDHSKGLEKSDLDSAALKITVFDSYLLHFNGDKFYKILSTLTEKDRVNRDKNAMDYRVECNIRKVRIFLDGSKWDISIWRTSVL